MPRRECTIETARFKNLLTGEGYRFIDQKDRVMLYRKEGVRVNLPRRDFMDEIEARAKLRLMGFDEEAVEAKVAALKA